jgi:hypothetical protein
MIWILLLLFSPSWLRRRGSCSPPADLAECVREQIFELDFFLVSQLIFLSAHEFVPFFMWNAGSCR